MGVCVVSVYRIMHTRIPFYSDYLTLELYALVSTFPISSRQRITLFQACVDGETRKTQELAFWGPSIGVDDVPLFLASLIVGAPPFGQLSLHSNSLKNKIDIILHSVHLISYFIAIKQVLRLIYNDNIKIQTMHASLLLAVLPLAFAVSYLCSLRHFRLLYMS